MQLNIEFIISYREHMRSASSPGIQSKGRSSPRSCIRTFGSSCVSPNQVVNIGCLH